MHKNRNTMTSIMGKLRLTMMKLTNNLMITLMTTVENLMMTMETSNILMKLKHKTQEQLNHHKVKQGKKSKKFQAKF